MATVEMRDPLVISSRSVDLPITHELTLPYAASLLVALLIAVASGAALVTGSVAFYGVDATVATAVAPSTGGLLVPGFLAQDVFSLVVALPTLLGLMWAARRGSLIGLLLWIGSLVYVLYTYVHYLVGAPFNSMFLAYVALVSSAAFTSIALVASVDGERVRRRLGGAVPARLVGGILVGLGLLTLAQDGSGSLSTVASGLAVDPGAHAIWIGDLAIEVPAMLIGGVLLWLRQPLGYVVGAGLLFQFGLTPFGLAAMLAAHALLNAGPIDAATIAGVLVFGLVALAPLAYFLRGGRDLRTMAVPSALQGDTVRGME